MMISSRLVVGDGTTSHLQLEMQLRRSVNGCATTMLIVIYRQDFAGRWPANIAQLNHQLKQHECGEGYCLF